MVVIVVFKIIIVMIIVVVLVEIVTAVQAVLEVGDVRAHLRIFGDHAGNLAVELGRGELELGRSQVALHQRLEGVDEGERSRWSRVTAEVVRDGRPQAGGGNARLRKIVVEDPDDTGWALIADGL